MAIWDVDSSCTLYPDGQSGGKDYSADLQAGFNTVQGAVDATLFSLRYVLQKRPNRRTDPDGFWKWVRIAESMVATVGWAPQVDLVETETSNPRWKWLFEIFTTASNALKGPKNDPQYGYNEQLYSSKPMITCGDGTWTWVKPKDYIPDHGVKLEDNPTFKHRLAKGAVGAWYLEYRLEPSLTGKKPVLYETESDYPRALTAFDANVIFIHPSMFTAATKAYTTLDEAKNGNIVQERERLSTYLKGLDYLLLHEMMHWFGGWEDGKDGQFESGHPVVQDNQAVDADGKFMYNVIGKPDEIRTDSSALDDTTLQTRGWQRIGAYGPELVFTLARRHPGTAEENNSGPNVAMYTADTLSTLAAMLYLEGWNWAHGTVALHPNKIPFAE